MKVTSELAHFAVPIGELADVYIPPNGRQSIKTTTSGQNYEQYSVNIASGPAKYRRSRMSAQRNKNNAALEANTAAWGYTKVALLFFVSLLITWVSSAGSGHCGDETNRVSAMQVPSSINRVYSLAHPNAISASNEYAAGLVLSLMGFWNSVIYFTTSRAACKTLILRVFAGRPGSGSYERRRSSDDFEPGRRSNSRWSDGTTGRGYSV